jgi:hypothetical protein
LNRNTHIIIRVIKKENPETQATIGNTGHRTITNKTKNTNYTENLKMSNRDPANKTGGEPRYS